LSKAREIGAIAINFEQDDPVEQLGEQTDGAGTDKGVDAVGYQAVAHEGVVSHELPLTQAPDAYEKFDKRVDRYTKVVLHHLSEAPDHGERPAVAGLSR